MALLIVPPLDEEPWPTLGPQVCDMMEDRFTYGPGSLEGLPYVVDAEFRGFLYRAYEVFPKGHPWAGRRRFKRCGMSVRKGLAKCLAPGTPVLTAGGVEIEARDVTVGELVVSYSRGRLTPARVVHVETQPSAPTTLVTTVAGRRVQVTDDHPFLVRGELPPGSRFSHARWVEAAWLRPGDRLVSVGQAEWARGVPGRDAVSRVSPAGGSRTVAIEVEGTHTHVTGGLVTHNTEKEALIVGVELHPEGPVRCDGFDARGEPVGRPVVAPYIPMLAYTREQVEELAYGALKHIIEHSPDSHMFDVSLERVMRLDEWGRDGGRAVAVAQAPDAADGKRTTLNAYDEPHRMVLPRQVEAHNTMEANLPKRPLEDPWSLYVGTAGEPGEGSVGELVQLEAEAIRDGKVADPKLFYLARWAGGTYDLDDFDQRVAAITEATGPAGEWGPGQFADIASQWDRPGTDKAYLERVWLNRWRKSDSAAFDLNKWEAHVGAPIPDGAVVTVGFDGARFFDSTGLVVTELDTGVQRLFAGWERPETVEDWEVPEPEVTAAVEEINRTYRVVLAYGDPPHWTSTMGEWAGRFPYWREWWTNRLRPMAYAVRAFTEGVDTGAVSREVGRDPRREQDLTIHIGNAGRDSLELYDDQGRRLFVLKKTNPTRKFDYAMAAVLSYQARLDALSKGLRPEPLPRPAKRFGRIY